MVTEGACPLIIGQWGVQCSAGAMCNQHEPNAETGRTSTTITSAQATSLNQHVMFLKDTTRAVPALAVMQVTAACRRTHRPTSRAGDYVPAAQSKAAESTNPL